MKHLPFHEALEDCSRLAGKVPQALCLDQGDFPVIGQGKQEVDGFINDSGLVFRGDLPVILFGDHTAAFKFVGRPFARGADGTKLFRPRTQLLDAKFAWHFLQTVKLPDTGYDRKTKYLENLKIPLPPLEEQRRIVAILDKAQHVKEKADRRSRMLTALGRSLFIFRFGLPSRNPYEHPIHKLVDICNPKQWPTISSRQLRQSGYPVFGANGPIGYFDKYNHLEPVVLVTCRGATCGTVNISPPKCYVTGNSMAMDDPDPELITTEYLAWVLRVRGMRDVISGSAQPQITRQGLQAVTIPVPSIDEQIAFANELRSIAHVGESSRLSGVSLSEVSKSLSEKLFGSGSA
jgi:hypothetical protein